MLGRQTAMGGILLVGARLITRVFDLASMVVLARILLPTDFGLVAIALTVVSVVEAILELPLNQALMRLPEITAPQYDTAFTLSMLRGLVLTLIVLVCAFPFAGFYHDQRLVPLMCLLSLAPAARGATSPRLAEYQKKMSFWRDFSIELIGKTVGFSLGFGLALTTHSYWSIAAGTIASPVTMALVSSCVAPHRPRLTLSESHIFTGFVGWMSAAQIISALNWQFERLLLGKLQTTSQLGLFTTASDMGNIPINALFGPIMRPLLAAFAQVRDDAARLARSYQTASAAVITVGVPILVGECLMAHPAISLVLGEKWIGAVPLLQWLSISLIPGLFGLPAIPLFMVFGNTKLVLKRNLVEFSFKLPLCIIGGITHGFYGIIFARLVSEGVAALFCIHIVKRVTGLGMWVQLVVLWRAGASVLAMSVPVAICVRNIPATASSLETVLILGMTAFIGGVTYAVALWVFWVISGRPQGIEAVAMGAVDGVVKKIWKSV